jgi:hypothetical protein
MVVGSCGPENTVVVGSRTQLVSPGGDISLSGANGCPQELQANQQFLPFGSHYSGPVSGQAGPGSLDLVEELWELTQLCDGFGRVIDRFLSGWLKRGRIDDNGSPTSALVGRGEVGNEATAERVDDLRRRSGKFIPGPRPGVGEVFSVLGHGRDDPGRVVLAQLTQDPECGSPEGYDSGGRPGTTTTGDYLQETLLHYSRAVAEEVLQFDLQDG